MPKVSIGLRGWRFEEAEVFEQDGGYRPLDEMPQDAANRISRLSALVTEPCHACYLIHGSADVGRCNVAEIVYGEPMAEVLLCAEHEPDFLYWYREAGGEAHRGEAELRDAFHEWFADGGRAPEEFEGVEHVEAAPDDVPEAPDPTEELPGLEEELEALAPGEREALDVDLSDLDLDADLDV
jgi:hypothetical protein